MNQELFDKGLAVRRARCEEAGVAPTACQALMERLQVQLGYDSRIERLKQLLEEDDDNSENPRRTEHGRTTGRNFG